MDDREWQLKLLTPARKLSGRTTQVVVGVMLTDPGGPQIAMRIGEDGETVILPAQATNEVIANLRHAVIERHRADKSR